jgi:type I restriction enzyme S subunit
MPMSYDEVLRLVREFHEQLAALYGDRLKGVYLYGSYARGDAREDSDIDIAVVLEGPVDAWEEDRRTSEITDDLSLRHNGLLMPFFLSEQEHRQTPYAVHRNIVREGVRV